MTLSAKTSCVRRCCTSSTVVKLPCPSPRTVCPHTHTYMRTRVTQQPPGAETPPINSNRGAGSMM
jgi:hypothetical protein